MYRKTHALIRALTYFLVHVIIYLPVNIFLVLVATTDNARYWWLWMLVFFWAALLLYHCFYMNRKKGDRSLKSLWQMLYQL